MTSSNTRAVKRGHSRGHSTLTSAPVTGAGGAGVLAPGRGRERRSGGGVQLARDPVHAEAVRPVGRHLELEHLGRSAALRQRRAGRQLGVEALVEHHDPSPPADPSSLGRIMPSEHAAQLALELLRRASRPGAPRRRSAGRDIGAPQTIVAGARRAESTCTPSAGRRRGALGAARADDEVSPARRGGGSPRPSCRSSSAAPRRRTSSPGRSIRAARQRTLIRTAPGTAGRFRSRGADRGCRA